MGRGIERRGIFADDEDQNTFLRRLEKILIETKTVCLAWALIPNHFHLLLRTGTAPIATIMRRLLTGYAQYYNRRHKRHGQLFQNRYKSILCQEEPYLLELVRYIHLNPLRAGKVKTLEELDAYPFSGHSALMGTAKAAWQDVDFVLGHFGEKSRSARKHYHTYVEQGVSQGRRDHFRVFGHPDQGKSWGHHQRVLHRFSDGAGLPAGLVFYVRSRGPGAAGAAHAQPAAAGRFTGLDRRG